MAKMKFHRRGRRALGNAVAGVRLSAFRVEPLERRVMLSGHALMALAMFNGANGLDPQGGVVLDSSANLFGTTYQGGGFADGTVFEIAKGSGAITDLASFNAVNGEGPLAGVVLDSSGDVFGTTSVGGDLTQNDGDGDGTVFEIAQGSGTVTTLATFNGANGDFPGASPILDSSGDLFGTAIGGGDNGDGTVFEIANGSDAITTLASFNGDNGNAPSTDVVLDSSGNLFGTTNTGGDNSDGTVFEIANASMAITTLVSFNGANGAAPSAGVLLDSLGNLFGTCTYGGDNGDGTVFEIASGSGAVTTLASFNATNGSSPEAALVMDSSANLFGTTTSGGIRGAGTIFEIAHATGTISTLASFGPHSNAYLPSGVVLDSSGNLLGMGADGGASGDGLIFEDLTGAATAVTSGATSPLYGLPVTFTATVTPNLAVGPTGTVQFQIDGGNVGSPVPLIGNTALYTTSTLDAGSHSVVAVYSGDDNFTSTTSPAFTQSISPAPLNIAGGAAYLKLDPDKLHVDVWNNSTAAGAPAQSLLASDISSVTYTGPAGGDVFVLDFSNGDPIPAGGVALTGGAGPNTLQIIGNSTNTSDLIAIDGGSFAIPANAPGAGPLNDTLGAVSIAAGAELAMTPSDAQADQTVLSVNALSIAGTLDIANNTLLANETNLSMPQVTTLVQNAGSDPCIMSSFVTGPNSQASRAVGYGDSSEDPLTVPAGDVEVKYVPYGDDNLDGTVDITDLTRAINNLGLSPGYYGGDVANQGLVNINDIADIINDLGANLNAAGDSANRSPAAFAAVPPPSAGPSAGSLFSDAPIHSDWLAAQDSILTNS